jgi:hypothetical protein
MDTPTPMQGTIDDPFAVINSLQRQVRALEGQLAREQEKHARDMPMSIRGTLKNLRLYGIIPLYVGSRPYADVRGELEKEPVEHNPKLGVLAETWDLQRVPVPEDVRNALRIATNYGNDRY